MLYRLNSRIRLLFSRKNGNYLPKFDEVLIRPSAGNPAGLGQSDETSLVDWFREREHHFFVGWREIPQLAKALSEQSPESKYRICNCAEAYMTKGLPIYAHMGPSLGPDFWSSLKLGPNRDILYPVRPHRFGFAPVLSQALLFGFDAVEIFEHLIDDWMAAATSKRSKWSYTSNLVVIYRLVALSWSAQFIAALDNDQADSLLAKIIRIIHADIRFLSPRLGDSYPNNHLLADYFAGWFISFVYPEFVQNKEFSGYEVKWINELERQFYDDGGSFEHSVHYHELGCELAVMYWLLKRENGEELAPQVANRITAMIRFQAALADGHPHPFLIGDTTQDPMLPLAPDGDGAGPLLHEIYRNWVEPAGAPVLGENRDQLSAYWVLAGKRAQPIAKIGKVEKFEVFPSAGFFRFAQDQSEFLFRTGVAPDTAISPGHMSSDLLSLYWRHNGQEVLTTPGTYSYKFNKVGAVNYRDHMMSRHAISGLNIADEDPLGALRGDFRDNDSGTRVETRFLSDPSIGAWCEGTVSSPTIYDEYVRGVVDILGSYFLVYDITPRTDRPLNAHIGWQFGPEITLETTDSVLRAQHPAGTVAICNSGEGLGELQIAQGSVRPCLGWVAPRYGEVTPAPYAYYPVKARAPILAFLMLDEPLQKYPAISVAILSSGLISFEITGNGLCDRVLLNRGGAGVAPADDMPGFDGSLLVIQETAGRLALMGLGIKTIDWPAQDLHWRSPAGRANIKL